MSRIRFDRRRGRVWRLGNIAIAAVWCVLNAPGGPVAAQDGVEESLDPPTTAASVGTSVGPADGLVALDLVQGWVRRGSVEPTEAEALGRAERAGLFGVRVCLRLGGRVMGTGEAYLRRLPDGGEDGAVDMVGLLRTATEDAISAAKRRLRRGADAEPGSGPPREMTWATASGLMTASVELAYDRRRLPVGKGGAMGLAAAGWVPGVEGLRVAPVVGDGPGGVAWPGWALATNMDAGRQLSAAMSGAGFEPGVALGMMAVPGRVLERFDTVHAARPGPELWPVMYERGLPTDEPIGAANAADVQRAGERLTEHLLARVTSDGGVLGDYEPGQDRWQPARSTGASRAAVLLALTEARAAGWVGDADWERVESAMRAAASAWSDPAGESDPPRVGMVEGGMLLGALADPIWSAAWADRARGALAEALAVELWRAEAGDATDWGVIETIALWGLARASARAGGALAWDDTRWDRVTQAGEAMLARGDVAGLWWLGRAREAIGEPDGLPPADVPAETRAALGLLSTQRLADPESGRRSEVGGLMGVEPAGAPEPTWKTAAGLGWLSLMARQAQTPGDRFALLLGMTQAAGFVERLQLTPTRLWYGLDRPAALYGVRASLTDHALPAGPNAISLLALLEVIRTTAADPTADLPAAPPSTADVDPSEVPSP
ncbi:MAG: hypothetical protein AAFY08_13165 [Planctomycetota bacterium]